MTDVLFRVQTIVFVVVAGDAREVGQYRQLFDQLSLRVVVTTNGGLRLDALTIQTEQRFVEIRNVLLRRPPFAEFMFQHALHDAIVPVFAIEELTKLRVDLRRETDARCVRRARRRTRQRR